MNKTLLSRSIVAILTCGLLVALCYVFVDRQVALFVRDHDLRRLRVLWWLQALPPLFQDWAPAVLTALMVRRAWGPFRPWERVLLAAGVSLLIAVQFKDSLKYCFGRYWPDTWINGNPSFLHDGAYGFHPFHGGAKYGSFPSGHMTRTLSIAAVVWIASPRWRWACVVATALVAIGLVGMNYHFVGDVIAGSCVGGIVGVYSAHGFGLVPAKVKNDLGPGANARDVSDRPR